MIIPHKINKALLGVDILKAKFAVTDKFVAWLADTTPVDNPRWHAIMGLANRAIPSAYLCNPDMQICIILRVLLGAYKESFSLRNPAFLITASAILNIIRMAERSRQVREIAYKTRSIVGSHPLDIVFLVVDGHWGAVHEHPYTQAIAIEREGLEKGRETGDPGNTGSAIFLMHLNAIAGGMSISKLLAMAEDYTPFFKSHPDIHSYHLFYAIKQFAKALNGRTENSCSLTDAEMSESELTSSLGRSDGHKAIITFARTWALFNFGDLRAALRAALFNPIPVMLPACFTGALNFVMLAICLYRAPTARPWLLKLPGITPLIQLLIRLEIGWWNRHYRFVMAGHGDLLEGERLLAKNRFAEGWTKLEAATQKFRDSAQHFWVVYTLERYGRTLLAHNLELGWRLIRQAHQYSEENGFLQRMQAIEKEFPSAVRRRATTSKSESLQSTHATVSGVSAEKVLDISSILKATSALAGQIDLSILIEELLRITIENGGATFGALCSVEESEIVLEASASAQGDRVEIVRYGIAAEKCADNLFPKRIVNFVLRRSEDLIINTIDRTGEWKDDEFIAKGSQRSLVCLPIKSAGKTLAILYLENSLLDGAFTLSRMETLKILASQGAIALKNARYVNDIKGSSARIRQLNGKLEKVLEGTKKMASSRSPSVAFELAIQSIQSEIRLFDDVACVSFIRDLDGKFRRWNIKEKFTKGEALSAEEINSIEQEISQQENRLAIAIRWQEQTLGLMTFQRISGGHLSAEEKVFVDTLTQSLGLSLANIEYQNNLETKVEQRTLELNDALVKVTEHSSKIQAIMDNIDEGILTVRSGLQIEKEFSAYLTDLLGKSREDLIDSRFDEVIIPHLAMNDNDKAHLQEVMGVILDGNEFDWLLNEGSLPREISANVGSLTKLLAFEWKPMFDLEGGVQKLMITIRDVTEQRRMEERLAAHEVVQKRRMDAILCIMALDRFQLRQFLDDSERRLAAIRSKIDIFNEESHLTQENQRDSARNLHTVKGTSRILGFETISQHCHEAETVMAEKGTNAVEFVKALDKVQDELTFLGDMRHEMFGVQTAEADAWNLVTFAGGVYSRVTSSVKSVGIEIGSLTVDDKVCAWPHEICRELPGMLIHCINNSVDHGYILPMRSGTKVGKLSIALKSSQTPGQITIQVIDSGVGLNLQKLSKIGKEKGVDPLEVPFLDDVSTADVVTISSGRGVGLAAVRRTARLLGGEAILRAGEERGTICEISFKI